MRELMNQQRQSENYFFQELSSKLSKLCHLYCFVRARHVVQAFRFGAVTVHVS